MSLEMQVRQFNEVFGVPTEVKPKLPNQMESILFSDLVEEEFLEFKHALAHEGIDQIAKEAIDLIYVTAQQLVKLGFPVDALLAEVQRSNMSKLDAYGRPIYREDGKVLKGPDYSKADIVKVLSEGYVDV
jgi:predicted HAD superfamily Cof-like phosphohydrolase